VLGITLVVAAHGFFIPLAMVIIFHQMFEGIALGSRIAALGQGNYAVSAHMHSHEPGPSDRITIATEGTSGGGISLFKKLIMAGAFALVTAIGMAIGIGVLHRFNGNDASTVIAIGTLDAFSAGILIWIGLVEMLANDWMLGGELMESGMLTITLGILGLLGLILMSLLGKWA